MAEVWTAEEAGAALSRLAAAFGGRRFSIGQSVFGAELWGAEFGRGAPRTLVAAGFHAQETLCGRAFLAALAARLAKGELPYTLCVLPLVNPDGAALVKDGAAAGGPFEARLAALSGGDFSRWQANGRGVDLNHNFDAAFAEGKRLEAAAAIEPGGTRYSGLFPESEPETAALCAFVRAGFFARAVALHSQGHEIYADFRGHIPPGGAAFAGAVAQKTGYRIAEVTGYTACGGFKDWFIAEFDRPALTLEMGEGKNPLPLADLPLLSAEAEALLAALEMTA